MRKYIVLFLGSLLLFSCRDYLDIVPKGFIIPTTVSDYELLLIGGDNGPNLTRNEDVLNYSNDNFYLSSQEIGNTNNNLNINFALYSWSDFRYADQTVSCTAWNDAYRNIYTYNKIINEVNDAVLGTGDTEEMRKQVRAQALYGRAYEYLFLVNTFSKQYSEAGAGTDLGVPLVLQANVTQKLPSRGTVASIYDQITADLNAALPNLPKSTKLKSLPSIAAGYALLARTYIYKSDYKNSKIFAEKALGENSVLVDYTQPDFSNFTLSMRNNEQYALHYMSQPGTGFLSEDALALFPDDGSDVRLTEQFIPFNVTVNGATVTRYQMGSYDYNFKGTTSVSVPEMYVTLAESNARLGNADAAVDLLNKLRNKRIFGNLALSTSDFSTQTSLVKFCLDERRREMIYTNTRLFDLKRENLETAFAKITVHKVLGTNPLTFTAAPNSNKLVLPIPAQVLKFNPDMPQNK